MNKMQATNTKQLAAERAVTYIQDGMTVGLGTGSTAAYAIKKLGERVAKEHLQIRAIATSQRSEELARELNIPIVSFDEIDKIDLTIDGADEVDEQLNLIKGGGGALLREKVVATNSRELIIIVDETKLVKRLGRFPLPVEVVPFALTVVKRQLEQLDCIPKLRMQDDKSYITDNGNYILDCYFGEIKLAAQLHDAIKAITGVVDSGLFIQLAKTVIAAYKDCSIQLFTNEKLSL
jgi:ribose 5-phosphate isomerase A